MNEVLSRRDYDIAQTVAWCERERLHPNAIAYAKRYVKLGNMKPFLVLISQYENAANFPPGPARDAAVRQAWDDVIAYVRTLSPKED